MAIKYRMVAIDQETLELLKQCKLEFIKHHPEFQNIPISNRKIVNDIAHFYLRT